MRILFVSESGECLPMSQINSRVFRSKCFLVFVTCSPHVRRLSKWRPRYLTVSDCGMIDWLTYTSGQVSFRKVKVMCADFVLFIFIRHFRVQRSILRRWAWMFIDAVVGFQWVAIIAVSSAKVLRTFWRFAGSPPCLVCTEKIPGWSPEEPPSASWLGMSWHCYWKLQVSVVVNKNAGVWTIVGVRLVVFSVGGLDAELYRRLGLYLKIRLSNIFGLQMLWVWYQ